LRTSGFNHKLLTKVINRGAPLIVKIRHFQEKKNMSPAVGVRLKNAVGGSPVKYLNSRIK
jgi:hypothetical protein